VGLVQRLHLLLDRRQLQARRFNLDKSKVRFNLVRIGVKALTLRNLIANSGCDNYYFETNLEESKTKKHKM
jgi:hypothetical protein